MESVRSGIYVIARTASGRPSLQHILSAYRPGYTQCGQGTTHWSLAYQPEPLLPVLCKKCDRPLNLN